MTSKRTLIFLNASDSKPSHPLTHLTVVQNDGNSCVSDTVPILAFKLSDSPHIKLHPRIAETNNKVNSKRLSTLYTPTKYSLLFALFLIEVSERRTKEQKANKKKNMGSEGGTVTLRKPRFLCLHGFRTSGEILKTQVTKKWPESVTQKLDLVYLDAPFPCQGKSEVEGIFDPPYYEWFQFNKEFTEYTNFDECLKYIEDYMIKNGPFDGLLGFSQGAILSAGLPGLQAQGVTFTKVPKIKSLIIIGGAKFRAASLADKAYSTPIQCPSLHFLGETDFLKEYGKELLEKCVDPVVIHHPKGHTIPRLDEKGLQIMESFLERIQKMVDEKEIKE